MNVCEFCARVHAVGLVTLRYIYGRVTYTGDFINVLCHAFYTTTSHHVTVLVISKYVQRKSSEQNSKRVLVN